MGRVIRASRQRRGLTQAELGSRLGVRRQTIGAWEHGADSPSLTILPELARALGVRPELFAELPLRNPERFDI